MTSAASNPEKGESGATTAPLFTMFTPTYNRGHSIHRIYESLCAQTLRDFEWLVVDNASTDGTQELIERWQAAADFPIRYIRQPENKGLTASMNVGVQQARGRFFIYSRSADSFPPQALERLKFHWDAIPTDKQHEFSGVCANCVDEHGRFIGTEFPAPVVDAHYAEMMLGAGVKGEKSGFVRTDIMREFVQPFVPGNTGYIPETTMWRRIGQRYKTRYVNESLRVFWQDQVGGQSSPARPWAKAYGGLLDATASLDMDIRWLWHSPLYFLIISKQYARCSFHLGRPLTTQWRRLPNARARLLWLLTLAPAWLIYLHDDWHRRKRGEPRQQDPERLVQGSLGTV
jgi:glycosyltransferase involved in cell wall biosynthesis